MADIRVTSLLDNFDRADEDPLSGGGSWGQLISGGAQLRNFANQAHGHNGFNNWSYWTPEAFTASGGDEIEVWSRPGGAPDFNDGWRMGMFKDPGGAFDGYNIGWFSSIGDNTLVLSRSDNGVDTRLLTVRPPPFGGFPDSGGDTPILLFRTNGNDVEFWHSADDGANWTLQAAATDTTYRTGLYLALGLQKFAGATHHWDDFGGGTETIWHPEFMRRPWEYQGQHLLP